MLTIAADRPANSTKIYTMEALLEKIRFILDKNTEISKLKKERFNIFNVIRRGHEEVDLHSAFLTELLNPCGRHDFDDTFLRLFIEKFGLQESISSKNLITIQAEKTVVNGRVDIYLKDEETNFLVLIENKIYAPDQDRQLARYYELIKDSGRGQLFYLTLEGREPSEEGLADLSKDKVRCISYESDIIEWLESCHSAAVDYPILRETIKQYIMLLKSLTGQLQDNIMTKEIIDIMKDNFAESKLIVDNFYRVELHFIDLFANELSDKLKEDGRWEVYLPSSIEGDYAGIFMAGKNWKDGIKVGIEPQPKIIKNSCALGIRAHSSDIDRAMINDVLEQELRGHYKCSTQWWPYYHLNYNFKFLVEQLADITKRKEVVNKVYTEMVGLAEIISSKDQLRKS